MSLQVIPRLVPIQMVQMFSHCVLGSVDEMDLDELLATKLVTFMMEHHNTIFQVPSKLGRQVQEHLSHLRRVQVSLLLAAVFKGMKITDYRAPNRESPAVCFTVNCTHFMLHLLPPALHVRTRIIRDV